MIPEVIITAVVVIILVWFITTYNHLVRKRNLMREAWSGMDVQLKRRHDLIPNLVETVKGYSAHERTVLENVAATRTEGLGSGNVRERGDAENTLTRSIKNLFALVEAYPDLKANRSFLDLQRNLAKVEEQIQYARRYYDGTVRELNILVESFPSNLVAAMFGFKPAEYFEIELATDREAPRVTI